MADGPAKETKKTCFVVMGFGEKTDWQTQRVLDLDKTYRVIIKRAVEDAGLTCIRADEIMHAGVIDKPMYEQLLNADVVVADLSTSNPNAIFELGVRHALRPHTTIVIAESKFKFPFDIHSLLIRPYEHLGKGIDAEEADRMRTALAEAVRTLAGKADVDSPVYTFLPDLKPPSSAAKARASQGEAVASDSIKGQLDAFREAKAKSDFATVKDLLGGLRSRCPGDPYLVQQHALATYKAKLPTPVEALLEAKRILAPLLPDTTQDAETLGLWGAIHKRLWEIRGDAADLDESVRAYERGFFLRNDHYNGINYAFLLTARADAAKGRDQIADAVLAERVRRRVISLCESKLGKEPKTDDGKPDTDEMFWLNATLLEAYVGVGDAAGAAAVRRRIEALRPADWMRQTLDEQLRKLQAYLDRAPKSA